MAERGTRQRLSISRIISEFIVNHETPHEKRTRSSMTIRKTDAATTCLASRSSLLNERRDEITNTVARIAREPGCTTGTPMTRSMPPKKKPGTNVRIMTRMERGRSTVHPFAIRREGSIDMKTPEMTATAALMD